jgi:DNA (cytosine-5)-methyltransferase 1
MIAYYNENDKNAAAWLRELIKEKLIAPGEVDERSIEDVLPTELVGYRQCHFFAGIGGWSYALRLAGWPDNKPIWTASCPCQPFSQAGQGKGAADERHLWPPTKWLIDQLRPPKIFGEQVASKDGRQWFAGVRIDLETMGYASGAADLCAASIGAPHIRQRLYWVGDSSGSGLQKRISYNGIQREAGQSQPGQASKLSSGSGRNGWGDNWIDCADGKTRRIEPGISPLAHGIPNRVELIRGYGNAIVPQVAAKFIEVCEELGRFP